MVAAVLPHQRQVSSSNIILKRACCGLTMVEIIVALALLGASIIPIWMSFYQSQANILEGQFESGVVNLGTAFSGQVRLMKPGTLTPTGGALPIALNSAGEYQLAGFPPGSKIVLPPWPGSQMDLSYEIFDFGPLPAKGRLVCLSVSWKGKSSRRHQITFPELVADE